MILVLPYPISANRYWISFWAAKAKRVITGVTKEAKAFKDECGWRAKAAGVHTPMEGTIELRIALIPKNKVCMDLDNALKVTIDALKGIVYADDSQVYRIVAERKEADPSGARLEIEIVPLVLPVPAGEMFEVPVATRNPRAKPIPAAKPPLERGDVPF